MATLKDEYDRLKAVEQNDPTEAARVRARIAELERTEASAVRHAEPEADDTPAVPVEKRPRRTGTKRASG